MHTKTTTANTNRRTLLLGLAAMGLGSTGLAIAATPPSQPLKTAAPVNIEIWKDPHCCCCKDWVVHLEDAGFTTTVQDIGNNAIRARLGMPQKLGSCHTGLVQGYVIEGHVPAADIARLLKEKPKALGLAVPGMPIGSPGMDGSVYGDRRDPYQVLLVQKDGSTTVFNAYT
jgi:hypothetical protein